MGQAKKDTRLRNLLRFFLIALCYTAPKYIRRLALHMLLRCVAPFAEDWFSGVRSDVMFASLGLLRAGDRERFEDMLGAFPFPERWHGMDKKIVPRCLPGRGWVAGTYYMDTRYGKSTLEQWERPSQ